MEGTLRFDIAEYAGLVREQKENEKKLEKIIDELTKAICENKAERLEASVAGLASLGMKEGDISRFVAYLRKYMPVASERAAKTVVLSALEKMNMSPAQLEKAHRCKVEKQRGKIRQQLLKSAVSQIFGGLSTEEDEKVAYKNFQKAIKQAKSIDDVVSAAKTYLLVKTNRELQSFSDWNTVHISDEIAERFSEEFNKASRRRFMETFAKSYNDAIKEGKETLAAQMLGMYLLAHGKEPALALELHDILKKALEEDENKKKGISPKQLKRMIDLWLGEEKE